MDNKKGPQLTDEQRAELKAIVKGVVREKLANREDLQDKGEIMRQIWKAMVEAPKWSIVESERPADAPTSELWSMTPTVNKP